MPGNVVVVDHPLIKHKLTLMRRKEEPTAGFRRLLRETGTLLGYEATRDLALAHIDIETPLAPMRAPVIEGKKLCLVSILRAGNGILEGMVELIPSAQIGHIGLYRDPSTLEPVEYYYKVPAELEKRRVIVVDLMLATGNSAIAAVSRLKQDGAKSIKFVCLLAAPEGLVTFHGVHPDVPVYVAAIDEGLNEQGYILPGVGDAGGRLFGTK